MSSDPFLYGVRHFVVVQVILCIFTASCFIFVGIKKGAVNVKWLSITRVAFLISAALLLSFSLFAKNFSDSIAAKNELPDILYRIRRTSIPDRK